MAVKTKPQATEKPQEAQDDTSIIAQFRARLQSTQQAYNAKLRELGNLEAEHDNISARLDNAAALSTDEIVQAQARQSSLVVKMKATAPMVERAAAQVDQAGAELAVAEAKAEEIRETLDSIVQAAHSIALDYQAQMSRAYRLKNDFAAKVGAMAEAAQAYHQLTGETLDVPSISIADPDATDEREYGRRGGWKPPQIMKWLGR